MHRFHHVLQFTAHDDILDIIHPFFLVNNQNHIQNLFTLYQIPVSASQISLDLHDHHVVCIRYYLCVKDTAILCVS